MSIRLRQEDSVVLLIDIQPRFMAAIHDAERVVSGALYLAQTAKLLGVPVIATVQNPERMGDIEPMLKPWVDVAVAKMSFSCYGEPGLVETLHRTAQRQVVIAGVETHICVGQTALDLSEAGYEVVVCPDAVSARSLDRHKLGMERIRDAGITPIHSEAVGYEWLGSADHPKFREALQIVKARPLS